MHYKKNFTFIAPTKNTKSIFILRMQFVVFQ